MADICKCWWTECPLATTCYRVQVGADTQYQSYCDFRELYDKETNKCEYYVNYK